MTLKRENIRRDFGREKTYKLRRRRTQTFIFGENKNELFEKEREKQKVNFSIERENKNESFFGVRETKMNQCDCVGFFVIHKPFGSEKDLLQ